LKQRFYIHRNAIVPVETKLQPSRLPFDNDDDDDDDNDDFDVDKYDINHSASLDDTLIPISRPTSTSTTTSRKQQHKDVDTIHIVASDSDGEDQHTNNNNDDNFDDVVEVKNNMCFSIDLQSKSNLLSIR
jgi:hypothetical protein